MKRADLKFHFVFGIVAYALTLWMPTNARKRKGTKGKKNHTKFISHTSKYIDEWQNRSEYQNWIGKQIAASQIHAAMKMSFLWLCFYFSPMPPIIRCAHTTDALHYFFDSHYLHFNLIFESISFCVAGKMNGGQGVTIGSSWEVKKKNIPFITAISAVKRNGCE